MVDKKKTKRERSKTYCNSKAPHVNLVAEFHAENHLGRSILLRHGRQAGLGLVEPADPGAAKVAKNGSGPRVVDLTARVDDTTIGANLSWRWAVELDLLVQRDGRVVAELEQNVATMDVCISSKRGKSAKTSSDMRCRCHLSGWRSQLTAVNDLGMSMKVVEGVKNRLRDHHDNRLAE